MASFSSLNLSSILDFDPSAHCPNFFIAIENGCPDCMMDYINSLDYMDEDSIRRIIGLIAVNRENIECVEICELVLMKIRDKFPVVYKSAYVLHELIRQFAPLHLVENFLLDEESSCVNEADLFGNTPLSLLTYQNLIASENRDLPEEEVEEMLLSRFKLLISHGAKVSQPCLSGRYKNVVEFYKSLVDPQNEYTQIMVDLASKQLALEKKDEESVVHQKDDESVVHQKDEENPDQKLVDELNVFLPQIVEHRAFDIFLAILTQHYFQNEHVQKAINDFAMSISENEDEKSRAFIELLTNYIES